MCLGPSVFRRQYILGSLYPFWLLHSFCLLFCRVSWAWGEGFNGDIPFRTEYLKVFLRVWSHQLQEKDFSYNGSVSCWSVSITEWGVIQLKYSFRRTIVFDISPDAWPISWPSRSVADRLHLMEWTLNPIRYWLISPTGFVPLLHHHILQARSHCKLKGL